MSGLEDDLKAVNFRQVLENELKDAVANAEKKLPSKWRLEECLTEYRSDLGGLRVNNSYFAVIKTNYAKMEESLKDTALMNKVVTYLNKFFPAKLAWNARIVTDSEQGDWQSVASNPENSATCRKIVACCITDIMDLIIGREQSVSESDEGVTITGDLYKLAKADKVLEESGIKDVL